jgi:hypothetical protein
MAAALGFQHAEKTNMTTKSSPLTLPLAQQDQESKAAHLNCKPPAIVALSKLPLLQKKHPLKSEPSNPTKPAHRVMTPEIRTPTLGIHRPPVRSLPGARSGVENVG